ncbi:MAG TPA: hypothetical protein VFT47_21385 [Vicinamibacterales bacterium]|nr:hypothetical protein [Vicinamibacterales bacterium]
MTALAFAGITFLCTFGCALLGITVRSALPPAHLSKESQDVVRLGMGLVATMTALLLGLVTAAAKGSFDSQDLAIRNAAAGMLSLDRLLARYGPETQPIRAEFRALAAARFDEIWPADGVQAGLLQSRIKGTPAAEALEDEILQLVPQTDTQRWLKTEALKLTEEVLRTRWRLLGSATGSVPRTFLVVVIFWLSMTFGSFGLAAPRNATVVTVFVISTFSVAAAVFLILELDGPFDGIVRISSEPFRYTLANLGK